MEVKNEVLIVHGFFFNSSKETFLTDSWWWCEFQVALNTKEFILAIYGFLIQFPYELVVLCYDWCIYFLIIWKFNVCTSFSNSESDSSVMVVLRKPCSVYCLPQFHSFPWPVTDECWFCIPQDYKHHVRSGMMWKVWDLIACSQ